jgi:TetR/AcrR family transcriptional repressor of nem operon
MNSKLKLIKIAIDQIQRKGYNGFSYADLADEMGFSKAPIHYHFPTKEDLGLSVANEYRKYLGAHLQKVGSSNSNYFAKIETYIVVFRNFLETLPQGLISCNASCRAGIFAKIY